MEGYQLGRELINSLEHVAGEARLENDVLTFDVARVPQRPEQRIDEFTRHIQEKPHAGNFASPLLRPHRERPRPVAAPPRSVMNSRRFTGSASCASEQRIAHLSTAGDCCAAGFRSGL